MPSRLLCENDATFSDFVTAIEHYLSSFTTDVFLRTIASVANSMNPFVFNQTSHEKYSEHHILVFRQKYSELFVRYCNAGLLDPDHVMGTLFLFLFQTLLTFE